MAAAIGRASHTTQWIPVKELSVIWSNAQRPQDDKWVGKIVENFDPDLFGVISVSMPNGKGVFHVIDGQHRIAVIKQLFGENEKVPCNVFEAKDPARAAQLFNQLNTSRKRPQSLDIFRVRVTAGETVEVAVNEIALNLGYKIGSQYEEGYIRATDALVGVYKRHGGSVLIKALTLIKSTWGMSADAVVAPIIRGYGAFVAEYPDADGDRLIDRMAKKFSPGNLIGAARSIRDGYQCSTDEAVKQVLVNAYNHGLRVGTKIGEKEAA